MLKPSVGVGWGPEGCWAQPSSVEGPGPGRKLPACPCSARATTGPQPVVRPQRLNWDQACVHAQRLPLAWGSEGFLGILQRNMRWRRDYGGWNPAGPRPPLHPPPRHTSPLPPPRYCPPPPSPPPPTPDEGERSLDLTHDWAFQPRRGCRLVHQSQHLDQVFAGWGVCLSGCRYLFFLLVVGREDDSHPGSPRCGLPQATGREGKPRGRAWDSLEGGRNAVGQCGEAGLRA